MKKNEPLKSTLIALIGCIWLWTCTPSFCFGWGDPCFDDYNLYTLHVEIRHDDKNCRLHKTSNHYFEFVGGKFTFPNDQIWSCDPAIHCSFNALGKEEGDVHIRMHDCASFEPYMDFDFKEYSLKLRVSPIPDLLISRNTASTNPASEEEAWEYSPFNPADPVVTVPVQQMLTEGYRTRYECCELEAWLRPYCEFQIENTGIQHVGFPYRYVLHADAANCTDGHQVEYNPSCFLWEYMYEGMTQFKPLNISGKTITIHPEDIPDLPFGKNVLIKLSDGRPSNSTNTQTLFFYPNIPQPVNTSTQTIPEGEAALREITLKFDRQLRSDLDERLSVITLYDTIAAGSGNSVSEARVIYQTSVNITQLPSNLQYTFELPLMYNISEGTYYVSVEGYSRGVSNHPDNSSNKNLPEDIKSGMFQIVPFMVDRSEIDVIDIEYTPPLCHGGEGSAVVTLGKSFISTMTPLPTFYYTTPDGSLNEIEFECEYIGSIGDPTSRFRCDHIRPGEMHHFRLKTVTMAIYPNPGKTSWGAFDIDATQPEPINMPVTGKNISGYYYVEGVRKQAQDGWIRIDRDQIRNGKPPYTITYRNLTHDPQNEITLIGNSIPVPLAGTFQIIITDANGCQNDTSITIKNLSNSLRVSLATESEITCHNAGNGSLRASIIQAGSNRVAFEWYKNGKLIPNETGAQLDELGPGTYTVSMKDLENGMVSTHSQTLTQPDPLEIVLHTTRNVYCKNEHTGYIGVDGKGGFEPYVYSWNDGAFGKTRSDLPAGQYQLKLIDDKGCIAERTFPINEPDSCFEIIIDSIRHAHYDRNGKLVPGKIFTHGQGGTRPYGWVYCDNDAALDQLSPGLHTVFQWDAMHCQDSKEFEIKQYDALQVEIVLVDSIRCYGERNASCKLIIEGGVPPYAIRWNTGSPETHIQNLAAGRYSATVVDAYGISKQAALQINQPNPLRTQVSELRHSPHQGCFADSCPPVSHGGVLRVNASGGTPPYHVNWTRNGQNFAQGPDLFLLTQLPPGIYQAQVIDRNHCQAYTEATLTQSAMLKASIMTIQTIGCAGSQTGILQAEVGGGQQPYLYQWFKADSSLSNARHLENISKGVEKLGSKNIETELGYGLYFLCVTDAKGVRSWAKRSLSQPEPIQISFNTIQAPSYQGSQNGILPEPVFDGKLEVDVQGGTPPYRYEWRKAGQNPIISSDRTLAGLDSGWYRLSVQDQYSCQADTLVYLPRTAPLVSRILIQDSISCHGLANGSLSLEISGGTRPYRIQWFKDSQAIANQTSPFLHNLKSSFYLAEVTDALDVKSSFQLYLPQPDSLKSYLQTESSHCHGDSSGWVIAHASGGTAPYRYIWILDGKPHSKDTSCISDIENADFEVSIIDSRGCQTHSQAEIKAPESLSIQASLRHPSYAGSIFGEHPEPSCDGKIELSLSGGTPPYKINWNHGDTAASLQGLDTGIYHVQIQDAHGCRAEQSFSLQRTTPLSTRLQLIAQPLCAGDSTASFRLDVQGGTPPYRYDWHLNGKWLSNDSLCIMHNAPAGTYTVQVQDSRGIKSMDSLSIAEPTPLEAYARIQHSSAWAFQNGSICLEVEGGTRPYQYSWNTGSRDSILSHIGRGTYHVRISDANRCEIEKDYTIQSPDSLYISSSFIKHIRPEDGLESEEGSIELRISGGMKPYRYQWENMYAEILKEGTSDSSHLSIQHLQTGIYRFHLQDDGGAEISRIFEIRFLRNLEATLMLKDAVRCHGDSTASVQAFIQGGTEPWQWQWEYRKPDSCTFEPIFSDLLSLENLPAGFIRLQIRDAAGQTASDSLEIKQPAPLQLETEILQSGHLPDSLDGIFVAIGSGGSLPYHYLWNTGNTESRQAFRNDQSYEVQLTDAQGCQVQRNLDSLLSSKMEIHIQAIDEIACSGDSSGSLRADIRHGRKPLHIRWSNGDTTAEISKIPAGVYTATVTDAWGNTQSASYLLREPDRLYNIVSMSEPSCHGSKDGHILVETLGGSGGIQYLWNTGAQTPDLFNLGQALYVLHTSDKLGCSRIDTVRMESPAPLRLPLEVTPIDCPDGSGRIIWKAQGGTAPYHYHWENISWKEGMRGDAQGDSWIIDPASAGQYILHVSDSLQCATDTIMDLAAPQPPSYAIERRKTLCAGQIISIGIPNGDTLSGIEYLWFLPDGSSSNRSCIQASQAGTYHLRLIQNQTCIYRDSVLVEASADSIHAEFWVSSHITEGQSCLLVNLSKHNPDSSRWILPEKASILMQEGNYIEILFPEAGYYPVELQVFKGNCTESYIRNIQVTPPSKQSAPGQAEGLSSSWRVVPNPFRNHFALHAECSQPTDVKYRILSALTGQNILNGYFHLPAATPTRITLTEKELPGGTYILLLEHGSERTAIKIIKTN